jgi:hypothetical protein
MLTNTRVAGGLTVWWLLVLASEVRPYLYEPRRKSYLVDADSISIPIPATVAGWLVFSALVAFVAWWLWRRATPTPFSWVAFDSSRLVWGLAWTVVLGAFGVAEFWRAASILGGQTGDFAIAFAGGILGFAARAGLCAPRGSC